MIYIVLIAGIWCFLIGIFVLIGNYFNRKNVSFAFFCFISSMWIFFNFLTFYTKNFSLLNVVYAFGTLMCGAVLSWTYIYFESGNALWKHFLIYFSGLIIAFLAFFTDLIIRDVYAITSMGFVMEEGGLFPFFSIYTGFVSLLATVRIFYFFKEAEGGVKRKRLLVFFGIGLFFGISLIVSVVLPTFGIFAFTNLDSVSSVFFVGFTFVAIYKHNFLGAKLVFAQLLILVIVSNAVIELLDSDSHFDFVLRSMSLLFVVALGAILIISIKREVRRKEELEVVNQKLLELDQAKSEFISMASHQLRTPLTTMKGFIGVMKKGAYGKMPKDFKEPMGTLENATNRLVVLVEDMLDVSRMELGKVNFEFKKGSINELIDELCDSFTLIAEERSVDLKCIPKKRIPWIMMDQDKIREVISNIIDNALKYTEKGSVVVRTECENDFVVISVRDTGVGVDPADMDKLFEKFSRGRQAKEMKKEGVGIGLYMGRKIVQAHRGKIYAQCNTDGLGMTFIIKLPITQN